MKFHFKNIELTVQINEINHRRLELLSEIVYRFSRKRIQNI